MAQDCGETCFECLSTESYCTVWTTENWCKNFILDCLQNHPDECINFKKIDDSMSVMLPKSVMRKIRFPKKRNLTDEQRNAIREKLAEGKRKKEMEAEANVDANAEANADAEADAE